MIHRQIIDDEIHANLDEGITNFEAGGIGVHKGFRGEPSPFCEEGDSSDYNRSGRPSCGDLGTTILVCQGINNVRLLCYIYSFIYGIRQC
jgi:hypothetical protein